MPSVTIFQAITIGIVEGLTEFLPISSTGHMILTSSFLQVDPKDIEFTKLFEVCIQLGAIMAVVVGYRKKFLRQGMDFYKKLLIAVSPALVLGFLLNKKIDALLESNLTVAWTMLIGGVALLFVDNLFRNPNQNEAEKVTPKQALTIGFWQVLAMVPGMSRSACTIVGGMQQKLTRKAAAEFSFFLAVPTMCAATGYKLLKAAKNDVSLIISPDHLTLLLVGNVVAFITAMLAIKTFIGFLNSHGFRVFGIYRVIMGLIVLGLIYSGRL